MKKIKNSHPSPAWEWDKDFAKSKQREQQPYKEINLKATYGSLTC